MTKQELKTKEEVKRLANKLGFQSILFADEFGHSSKEDLRYLLWMIELIQWLANKYKEIEIIAGVLTIVKHPERLSDSLLWELTALNKKYGTKN